MKIIPSSHFKRVYKKYFSKLNQRQRIEVERKIDIFISNPFFPELKTHKLATSEWSFTVLKDKDRNDRVVFMRKQDVITLLTIGSHDEVY